MKSLIPALLVAMLGATGATYAQSINIGPGGVSVDPRSPRERAVEREMRREDRMRERERERRMERRAERRYDRRGDRCRTITTREETRRGVVRRTTQVCD